ncbi:hypothetical protein [Acidithiobacillus sp.]|uniref:hypothetical protein n=1 Tax=Acidithiobacillus sp. TaxID=1872118 RepID=UPI0025836C94|nr:hypothetical protein [Acidithiobacillus sp.]MDD5374477.1 hypothetical protein [Acidithiobacillus sp.]
MTRAVLASVLEGQLRDMCDAKNDTHITTTELYRVLTSAVAETWGKIRKAGGNHFVKTVTFNTVADQLNYELDTIAPDADFLAVAQLDVNEGNGQYRPLTAIPESELQSYRAPTSVIPMRLKYAPRAPTWSTGQESFDGINGWEEHTLCTAAVWLKKKKQDDYQPFQQRKLELERRIAEEACRDDAEPPRVARKRQRKSMDYYAAFRNNVSRYSIRGTTLSLYYNYGYVG